MPAPEQLDDTSFHQRRFRFLIRCGIAIMLLFSALSFVELATRPGPIEALSAATDTTFTLLIGLYFLPGRLRLATAALLIGAAILVYSILNILFFPTRCCESSASHSWRSRSPSPTSTAAGCAP